MNCEMYTFLQNVYICSSKIRFVIMPDMLKNLSMLAALIRSQMRGRGGRGLEKCHSDVRHRFSFKNIY